MYRNGELTYLEGRLAYRKSRFAYLGGRLGRRAARSRRPGQVAVVRGGGTGRPTEGAGRGRVRARTPRASVAARTAAATADAVSKRSSPARPRTKPASRAQATASTPAA